MRKDLVWRFWMLCSLSCVAACGSCEDTAMRPSGDMDLRDAPGDVTPRPDPDMSRVDPCVLTPEGGFCNDGVCALVVPPGAVDTLQPVSLKEVAAPTELEGRLLGGRVCELGPDTLDLQAPLELRMGFGVEEIPEGFRVQDVVGVGVGDVLTRSPDALLVASRHQVLFSTDTPGQFGLTVSPSEPALERSLGENEYSDKNDASYLRALSRFPFQAVHGDGQRLYVGNGPRILVWNTFPTDPLRRPDFILGQPDIGASLEQTSSAIFEDAVTGLWSDQGRLVASTGNRVLIWNTPPTSSQTPADIVLGQPDFASNERNQDRAASRDTLARPTSISSDGQRLVVSDLFNNRVLVWETFPTVSGQLPDLVLGQPDFKETSTTGGQTRLFQPFGSVILGDRVLVSSRFGRSTVGIFEPFPTASNPAESATLGLPGSNRMTPTSLAMTTGLSRLGEQGVVVSNGDPARLSLWHTLPTDPAQPADVTLGKPGLSFGALRELPTASNMTGRQDIATYSDGQHFIATDSRRMMLWRQVPEYDYAPADAVFGQPSAATNQDTVDYRGVGPDTRAQPSSTQGASGRRVVVDRANSRVLLTTNDGLVTLGQPDAEGFLPNQGKGMASASTMRNPDDAFLDETRLVVADTMNHRVLIWNTIPTSDATPADVILGQSDPTATQPAGADLDGDGDLDATAATMHAPRGVYIQDNVLYVADTENHRVLVFDPVPTSSGAVAQRVLGQPELTSNDPNQGLGPYTRGANTLLRPRRVLATPQGDVIVADTDNQRVLIFGPNAGVLGQPDDTSNTSPEVLTAPANLGLPSVDSRKTASDTSLRRPHGLALDGTHLYVADTGNHRVVRYTWPAATGQALERVWGQENASARAANAGGLGASSLHSPEGLAIVGGELRVADTGNHRELTFALDAQAAHEVVGQASFGSRDINRSATARETFEVPAGASFDGTSLWVADTAYHRLVRYVDGGLAGYFGQPDPGAVEENAGQARSGFTLSSPADVWSDGQRMVIADAGNHRVLIWNQMPTSFGQPADIVLGQETLDAGEPNAGAGTTPSHATLLSPQGVFFDGTRLFVADTGNNRVLVWNDWPTQNGASADQVWCQEDGTSNLSNRGEGVSQSGCAAPRDVLSHGDRAYVMDTANNRVLWFDPSATTGASAAGVLGQSFFSTRVAAAGASGMSSPTRMVYDGASLFVADTANNRVLQFRETPQVNGAPASAVVGQLSLEVVETSASPDILHRPSGLAMEPLTDGTTRLYVSDAGKKRVAVFFRIAREF